LLYHIEQQSATSKFAVSTAKGAAASRFEEVAVSLPSVLAPEWVALTKLTFNQEFAAIERC
jgi:hypothetical protein